MAKCEYYLGELVVIGDKPKELNREIMRGLGFNVGDIKDVISVKNEDDPESASSRVGNASPVP